MSTYRHSIAPARINAAFNLTQIHSVGVSTNARPDVVIPGGALDPGAVILQSAEPMVSLATYDLDSLVSLSVSFTSGLNCSSGAVFYWQRRDNAGTVLGSGSHQKLASAAGFLMPTGINISPSGCEANLNYCPFSSDGLTQPLAYTDSVSLAASAAYVTKYYMGPVYLGSTPLNGVVGVSFSSGLRWVNHIEDGGVYPVRGSIYTRTPQITITMHSVQYLSQFTPHIANDAGTNLTAYMVHGVSGAARDAYASTVHKSVGFASLAWRVDSISGSGNEDATVSITADCIGTVSIGSGSAIPAS